MTFENFTNDSGLDFLIGICLCLLIGSLLGLFIINSSDLLTKNKVLLYSIFIPFFFFLCNTIIPILLQIKKFPVIGGIGWTIVGICMYKIMIKKVYSDGRIKIENVYANGQMKEKGFELNGNKIGFWEYYNEVYEIIKQETYDDKGILIKEKYFGDGTVESNTDIDNQISGDLLIENQTENEEIDNEDSEEEINNEDEIEEQSSSKKYILFGRIERWISNLNKEQKIIVAIAFPALLFCIVFPITLSINHHFDRDDSMLYKSTIWFFFITIIAFSEFKLFENKDILLSKQYNNPDLNDPKTKRAIKREIKIFIIFIIISASLVLSFYLYNYSQLKKKEEITNEMDLYQNKNDSLLENIKVKNEKRLVFFNIYHQKFYHVNKEESLNNQWWDDLKKSTSDPIWIEKVWYRLPFEFNSKISINNKQDLIDFIETNAWNNEDSKNQKEADFNKEKISKLWDEESKIEHKIYYNEEMKSILLNIGLITFGGLYLLRFIYYYGKKIYLYLK
jgi:hypothetical protein